MNAAGITMVENAETVSVGEFRRRIAHLEQLVSVDRHACKGPAELARWKRLAQRIGVELIATTCKRATEADWQRREKVIERSTRAILAI